MKTKDISWDLVNDLRQAHYSWDEIAEMIKTNSMVHFNMSGKALRSMCINRRGRLKTPPRDWGGTRKNPSHSKNWRSYKNPHDWCG